LNRQDKNREDNPVEFDNSFEVPVPVDEAWEILMDIERIAPCVPGAELTEVVDENTYKGKISVKLGPVALTFNGQTQFEEKDSENHTAKLKAQGTDAKGRGGAHAKVGFHMEPSDKGSTVVIHTDLQLSGAVAQYGRGVGMVKDLAQQIIGQFAANLEKNVIAPQAAPAAPAAEAGTGSDAGDEPAAPQPAAPPPQAAPVQVGSMGLTVLWNAIVRGIKRIFGGGS
jgi:carbon monoxide dehydrogenase subunit G